MMFRFIFIFFSLYNFLFAFEPIQLSSNSKIQYISKPLYLSDKVTVEKAYEKFKNNEFKPLFDELKTFGLFRVPFWISLEIQNSSDENLFLSFLDVSIEKATLYKFHNDVLIETKQSNSSTLKQNNILENLVPKFHLEKSPISYTYLVKIESVYPSLLEILIGNNSDIINALIPEFVVFLILIGSFLSLFFYNIFLYFSTKENDYILYSIFIFFLVSWIISFHGYFSSIFGLNHEIKNIIKLFTLFGSSLFLLLFTFKFLDIQNRYLKKLSYILLAITITFFMFGSFSCLISMLILISISSFGIYLGIEKFNQGYKPSKYYILALSGYLLGMIISFCMFAGILEADFYTLEAQLFGIIWVMIFLSLGLGYKLSLIQIERNNAILKAEIQEKMLFLQSRQASVGELVGNIAHQWREPLAEVGAIQTNLQANLLIKGVVTKEKILDSVEQSSGIIRHLSDTIDVFYRFFKNEKSDKSKFNVIDVMHDVRKMVHYILEVENISFFFEYKDEIYIFGDRNEFANAIINIILNAKDVLVDRKTTNPYIKIKIEKLNSCVVITIEDNAGGVKQEPIEKIFESCISSKSENIGIGLYIVKTIIEKRLSGKIEVKNSEFGAIFTIRLPLDGEIKESEFIHDLNMEESTLDRIYRLERKVEKQVELEKTLNQWEEIFNQTPWAVTLHEGMNYNFKLVNPAFCNMYGYTQNEVLTMSIIDFFTLESLNILNQKRKEAIEKSFVSFEALHLHKNGSSFPVNIDLTVIKNKNGDILYHILNIRDISEQKKANQMLLLKKFALNHIHEAVYLMNEKGEFEYVNESACKTLGYSEAELLKLNIGDVDADWPIERWPEHWNVIKEIKTMTMELRHKKKDGTIFPVEVLANYFEYNGVAYNMGLARDITERKAIEEKLLLKEFALNQINESVFLIDKNSKFHYVNEATCKSLGYTQEELLQMSVPDVDSYVSLEWWNEHWEDIKLNNTLTLTEHKRKDGTSFPIEISSNYFEYEGVEYSLAVSRDITDRLEAQKRKDEEKMRLFFEHKLVGMAITSPTKGWLHVNDKLCEMLGYSLCELKNMTWAQITHPDDLQSDVDTFNRMAKGEIDSCTIEKRYIKKDKTAIYVNLSIGCVRKEDGSVDYALVLVEDISERKKSEEKIRILNNTLEERVKERTNELAKKEREFRTLAENMPNFLSRYDKEGDRTYVNPTLCNYFGVSSEELIGTNPKKYQLSGVPQELYEKITYVLQTGLKTHLEIVDVKDGQKRWWTLIVAPEFDEKGEVEGVISIGHDITYIKEAEEQLQLLKTAVNNTNDAFYIIDDERNICYVSEASCKMLGYSYDEFLNMKVEDIDPFMSIEEINKIRENITLSNSTTFQTNHKTKDGKILDVEINVTRFVFDDTDLRLSIVKDITKLKEHEATIFELNKNLEQKVINRTKELQKALEFNKSIIQAIPDLLFEVSKEGIYLNVWARDEKLLAAQKEILLGKNFRDVLPPDVVEVAIKTINEVDKYGSSLGNMYKLDFPDGECWFEMHSTTKEPEGTYLVLARNVTERKKAQNGLIELNLTLEEKVKERTFALQKALEWSEEIINTLPDILFEMDKDGNYLGVWTQNKELLAQQKEMLIGNNIYNVLSKEASDTIMSAFEEINKDKHTSRKKISINLPQGTKEFELSISKKSDGNFLLLSREI